MENFKKLKKCPLFEEIEGEMLVKALNFLDAKEEQI